MHFLKLSDIGGSNITQDILVVLSKKDQPELIRTALAYHGIKATLAENIRNAFHSLGSSAQAFLLLDLGLDGANLFLDAIVTNFYTPPPYLLVTNDFSGSTERTNILNRGADVCLEKPIDAEEVLAVINAVMRRTARVQRTDIKLAPCITHLDLLIDPLRRTVVMAGKKVDLTTKEFDILYHPSAGNRGRSY